MLYPANVSVLRVLGRTKDLLQLVRSQRKKDFPHFHRFPPLNKQDAPGIALLLTCLAVGIFLLSRSWNENISALRTERMKG